MKTCKEIKNILIEYYYNEIDLSLKEEVKLHLKTCDKCNKEYEGIKKTIEEVSQIKKPVLPQGLKDKFYYEVKEKINKRILESYKIWRVPVIVSICLLVILIIVNYGKSNIDELDAVYMLSTSTEISNTELSSLDIDIITDEVFIDEFLEG